MSRLPAPLLSPKAPYWPIDLVLGCSWLGAWGALGVAGARGCWVTRELGRVCPQCLAWGLKVWGGRGYANPWQEGLCWLH